MPPLDSALPNFLLAFSALFSIVNPPASALIFNEATADRTHAERVELAGRIAFFSAAVMLVSLWGGVYVLSFFGITVDALRIAGGLVGAVRAWEMLSAPERHEERKQEQASQAQGMADVAFFPLTMPFTTGPGTMSVAIALGSNMPSGAGRPAYVLGASAAALLVAGMIGVAYRFADGIVALLGPARARVVSRINSFLLLCIGVQITIGGGTGVLREVMRP